VSIRILRKRRAAGAGLRVFPGPRFFTRRFNTQPGARFFSRWLWLALLLATGGRPAKAQEAPRDLGTTSIEDLMNIEVTSVSKKEQKLSGIASAVFVITAEDIQHSGALNIPDLLRMVPGVNVAQVNANTWAISARGLNEVFGHELLVVVDGRNAYSPSFGGVYWDGLDLPLENIERIEVIRGPGGSVWGANAVNGVINIITKTAAKTHGILVQAGAGNLDQEFATVQYGGSLGKSVDYRLFTKYFNRNDMAALSGQDGGDGWHLLRGGFRMDSKLSPQDTLSVQGDMYVGREGYSAFVLPDVTSPQPVETPLASNLSGAFLRADWNHVYSPRSESQLSFTYDSYERAIVLQDIVWGLGYRFSTSDSQGDFSISLNPPDSDTHLFSSFIQDEIAIVPKKLTLTVGTKLERDPYSGFTLMPSVRARYALGVRSSVWAAVSRAARTPAETDAALRVNFAGFTGPGGVPALSAYVGNPLVKNENLLAYDLGYRTSFSDRLSLDVSAYYNVYDHQITNEPGTPFFEASPLPEHLVFPVTFQNLSYGETHGLEASAKLKITDRWTLSPGLAFERVHMHTSAASQDAMTVPSIEGSDPHIQAQLRSHLSVTRNTGWDVSAYFVDRLNFQRVPSYTQLDSGLSWRASERWSLSVVGQNLLKDNHLEFASSAFVVPTLMKRGAYVKLTWQY
jgi:iron complex outermembrane receptor protein